MARSALRSSPLSSCRKSTKAPRPAALIFVLTCFSLAAGRTARAADDELAPRHAEVMFVAPTDDVQGLELVLGELLARLQVSVRFLRVPTIDTRQILVEHAGDPPAVARAWIDLRDPSRVTLFLSGAHQDRLLIRQVPLVSSRIDEVAREEIAHIVEATVDALLIGGRIGVITEEGPSKVPATPIPQRLRGGPRLDLSVGYEAEGWSVESGPLHGPSIFLGFSMGSGAVRGGFLASAQYRLSSTVTSNLPESMGKITTRLDQGSFRGLAVIDVGVAKHWTFRGGLGGGVDLLRFTPTTEASNVSLSAAESTTVPMLRALVAMRYSFTPRSDVFFGLGADFDLVNTRYVVGGPGAGQETVVFQPWRLRPLALVGIGSDILAQ